MTLRYAKIANRTVADEYFAVTEKVEALYGQAPTLPADADGPNMARLRREHHRLLGNGYCTRPAELDCGFESDLRDLHLLPDQHRVPAHPQPANATTPPTTTRPTAPTSSPAPHRDRPQH